MTWHNENKCPPLINKRKKRGKATVSDPQLIPVVQVEPRGALEAPPMACPLTLSFFMEHTA